MKRILVFISVIFIALSAAGCGSHRAPVAKVVLSSVDGGTKSYETVYDDGKIIKTDKFTPDTATIYQAGHDDFSSDIKDGKIIVTLKSTKMTDEDGNAVDPDDNTIKLMQWIADNSEHDIIEADFISLQDKYFAFVHLNVNWSDPCILYMYDSGKQQFSELGQWDNVKPEGISLTE